MSDDLVVGRITFLDARAAEIVRLESALEAKDAEIERLKEECAELRHGVEDQTEEAAYHKEQRAQAERALAEAVKVVESLLLSLSNNSSERVKVARQFVKEHSANADQ